MYSNISPDDPFMDMDENTKPIEDQSASEDQFQELMLQIMEAIEKELADEDWTQYEEFEHCVRAEEDCIAQLIQGNDNYDKDTNQESLLCPLCQKDLLQQQCQRAGAMSTAIICGCGLRIDAGDDTVVNCLVRLMRNSCIRSKQIVVTCTVIFRQMILLWIWMKIQSQLRINLHQRTSFKSLCYK
mmetsp:Transcript_12703/g.20921  ORF Transcript_12703/g.20921 Transcript_12703/m.20921 type:complete len:185 (+) Transcript_12703:113-667(+)